LSIKLVFQVLDKPEKIINRFLVRRNHSHFTIAAIPFFILLQDQRNCYENITENRSKLINKLESYFSPQ